MTLTKLGNSAIIFLLSVFTFAVMALHAAKADDHTEDLDVLDGWTAPQIEMLRQNLDEVIETAGFYSAFGALLLLLTVGAILQRQPKWATYAGLTFLALMWNALFEQSLSGLYWLGAGLEPQQLIHAGFSIALLSTAMAAFFAPLFLQTTLVFGMITIGVMWFLSLQFAYLFATSFCFAALILSACFHFLPISKVRSFKSQLNLRWYILATLLVLLIWTGVVVAELTEEFDPIFLNRAVVSLLTSSFIVLFLLRMVKVLRDRDAAILQSLADARKEAETSKALFESEKRYSAARELAGERSRRLATASHDIRQPISALRTTMTASMADEAPELRTQMKEAFDYLNKLAGEFIVEGREDEAEALARKVRLSEEEAISMSLLASTIERMFSTDAAGKGLEFKIQLQEVYLTINPLKFMRAVSNLTANAIIHTEKGYVELSGTISDGEYEFAVKNSATLEADTATLLQPYAKGDASGGSGLGLSIVTEIAAEEGFDFHIDNEVENQTTMRLKIPAQYIQFADEM